MKYEISMNALSYYSQIRLIRKTKSDIIPSRGERKMRQHAITAEEYEKIVEAEKRT